MALLAHLYSHIKGSQEDIATLSLQYIVTHSAELNSAFTYELGSALNIKLPEELNYSVQSSGKNRERPDISGKDTEGKEIILCEAKFYAGLTANQPIAYLDRLVSNHGKGLVFICPVARRTNLWSTLLDLCAERDVIKVNNFSVLVDGVGLALLTWSQIIQTLRSTAASVAPSYISDIDQLDSFCKQMDSEAFIPFSLEELGPETARKEERFYHILDGLKAAFKADKTLTVSTKGLMTNANRDGYVTHLLVNDFAVTVRYDRRMWLDMHTDETPFWVTLYDSKWGQPESFMQAFHIYKDTARFPDNRVSLALYPLVNATLDEVVAGLKHQIQDYMEDINKFR